MEIKTGKEMVQQFSAERGSCTHHLLGAQMDHCRRDRFLKGAENMGGSEPVTENQGPRAWCSRTAHHGARGRALSLQEAPDRKERNACPGQGSVSPGMLALPGPQTKQTGVRGAVSGHLGYMFSAVKAQFLECWGVGNVHPGRGLSFPEEARQDTGGDRDTGLTWHGVTASRLNFLKRRI